LVKGEERFFTVYQLYQIGEVHQSNSKIHGCKKSPIEIKPSGKCLVLQVIDDTRSSASASKHIADLYGYVRDMAIPEDGVSSTPDWTDDASARVVDLLCNRGKSIFT
jgi:hypothetical protein